MTTPFFFVRTQAYGRVWPVHILLPIQTAPTASGSSCRLCYLLLSDLDYFHRTQGSFYQLINLLLQVFLGVTDDL